MGDQQMANPTQVEGLKAFANSKASRMDQSSKAEA
jgi:hypothetical protein